VRELKVSRTAWDGQIVATTIADADLSAALGLVLSRFATVQRSERDRGTELLEVSWTTEFYELAIKCQRVRRHNQRDAVIPSKALLRYVGPGRWRSLKFAYVITPNETGFWTLDHNDQSEPLLPSDLKKILETKWSGFKYRPVDVSPRLSLLRIALENAQKLRGALVGSSGSRESKRKAYQRARGFQQKALSRPTKFELLWGEIGLAKPRTSASPSTRIAKLILHGNKSVSAAKVSKVAAMLDVLETELVAPDQAADWIERHGGIEHCIKRHRRVRA
jgi:hypothetical protein